MSDTSKEFDLAKFHAYLIKARPSAVVIQDADMVAFARAVRNAGGSVLSPLYTYSDSSGLPCGSTRILSTADLPLVWDDLAPPPATDSDGFRAPAAEKSPYRDGDRQGPRAVILNNAPMVDPERRAEIRRAIASVLNKHSAENGSNTPDFLLAEMLVGVLDVFNKAVRAREQWYGRASDSKDFEVGDRVVEKGVEHPRSGVIIDKLADNDISKERLVELLRLAQAEREELAAANLKLDSEVNKLVLERDGLKRQVELHSRLDNGPRRYRRLAAEIADHVDSGSILSDQEVRTIDALLRLAAAFDTK